MADSTPLRITCTTCTGDEHSEDCLVHFFLTERDATIVPLTGPAAEPVQLPADLATALHNLASAGLAPEVIDVQPNTAVRAS
jgi:hypothetical protein